MLDVAWPELIVVGVVTLVAVGPEDLPKVMHTMGRWVGRVRRAVQLLGEQIDQLDYETQVKDHLRKRDQAAEKQAETPKTAAPPPSNDPLARDDHDL